MDPRIRRRRIQVRRDAGRRRLRLIVGTLASLVAVGGLYGASRSPLLDADDVQVTGAVRTDGADIEALGLRRGVAMIDIDPARTARRLEALPWVGTARVHRRWPGTVVVSIVERVPAVAAPLPSGKWVVADSAGRVLAWAPARPAGAVELRGPGPFGPPGTTVGGRSGEALGVVAALAGWPGARLSTVEVEPGGDVQLVLAGGAVVRFGRPDQVADKVLALRTLSEHGRLGDVATIDLRVPSAPALTRHGGNK